LQYTQVHEETQKVGGTKHILSTQFQKVGGTYPSVHPTIYAHA